MWWDIGCRLSLRTTRCANADLQIAFVRAAAADGVAAGVSEQLATAAAAARLVPPIIGEVQQPAEAAPRLCAMVVLVRAQRLVPLVDVEGEWLACTVGQARRGLRLWRRLARAPEAEAGRLFRLRPGLRRWESRAT